MLTHKLFEKAVNPGTASRLTTRKCLFSWLRRRTHKLFCPVNRPVVPGSTGPWPEQKVYVYVPFSLPKSKNLGRVLKLRFWNEWLPDTMQDMSSMDPSLGRCRWVEVWLDSTFRRWICKSRPGLVEKCNRGCLEGGSHNSWVVLQPEVATAGEVWSSSKKSLPKTDLCTKKNAACWLLPKPSSWNTPVLNSLVRAYNFRHRASGVGRGGGQAVPNQILNRFHGIRLKSG